MPDHHAQAAELLARYRQGREHLASVHDALADIAESASDATGLVTVTVPATGTLRSLHIDDQAYRRYRPGELAELIVGLCGEATGRAVERVTETLAPALPSGTDPSAVVSGTADLRPDEVTGPEPPAAGHDDGQDTDFAFTNWLREQ